MLVLLPPSETKARRRRGSSLDLGRLSFPELTQARERVAQGLVSTSAWPDALQRLTVPEGVAHQVAANRDLTTTSTLPAAQLYRGVLYDALGLESLDASARRRATRWIVVVSALYGAVRLGDRLAPYRLPVCADLDGLGGLEAYWRQHLGPVLTAAAGRGVVVDCRSSSYHALWRPGPEVAPRWVAVRVPGASHGAKRTRGLVVRHLCQAGTDIRDVPALAEVVSGAFETTLREPERPGRPWVLDVQPPA